MVSQVSFCIPQLTLIHWSGQSEFSLYTQADSSSLGCSTSVPIVYPSWIWFAGLVSKGYYSKPQLTLVRSGGQPVFLLYTPANSGSLEWSVRALIVYPSWLAHYSDQLRLLLYTKADSGSFGWSTRVPIVYPHWNWFAGVVSQGSYHIPQPTLVCWGGQPGLLLFYLF